MGIIILACRDFINSMGLLHRENELHLFAPAPLQEILDLQLKAAATVLPYALHFHPLRGKACW